MLAYIAFSDQCHRFSVLPALSRDGIIGLHITEGSFDSQKFEDFISDLLNQMSPYPGPNSVVVMDNCRIHKDPEILKMIEER